VRRRAKATSVAMGGMIRLRMILLLRVVPIGMPRRGATVPACFRPGVPARLVRWHDGG
jgi:hypothetical protein